MQLHHVLGALGALLLQTATSAAAPPTWCKGGDAREKPSYSVKTLFTETDANAALINLVAASCYAEEDLAPYAKQIPAARAAWSKKLGLSEAEWVEVNEWVHLPREIRGQNTFDETDRKAAWSAYTPLDQYAALFRTEIGPVDGAYLADALGSKLTQLGRLGYVQRCFSRMNQDDAPVSLAMCATDVAALDPAKLAAEISADKSHGKGDRMTARIIAYETLEMRKQLEPKIAAMRKKEPAYDKMFQLGEAAHKAWGSVAPKLVQLADDLDAARVTGSRRASQGCMPRAQEGWKTAVEAIGAKRLAQIHSQPGNGFAEQLVQLVITEPSGYLAALALTECATLEDKADAIARSIGASLARWPGFRGPRTGTQTAILTAGLTLDQRDATIEYPELKRDWIVGDNNSATFGPGAVASLKAEGDKVTVTFAKQKVTQKRCTKGHSTSKIQRITSDGQFIYQYVCDVEITETIMVPPSPPLKVLARYADGVKAGMSVLVTDDVLVAAFAKGSAVPAIVTGVRVK